MEVFIRGLCVGAWKENSYIIEYGGEAWLIDPGDDFEELDNFFSLSQYQVKGIINTHGHFDHIGAVSDFKVKYDIPFYIHSKDKQLVRQGNLYRRLAGSNTTIKTPQIDFFLDDISTLSIQDKTIKIHKTPGHTQGSACFEIDEFLFTGDLFFKNVLGRTDLPGGDKELLNHSVGYILDNFHNYTIYPGHGSSFLMDDATVTDLRKLL